MTITLAVAVYFVMWWTVLFVVLPFGVKSQVEMGEDIPGTDPGAPSAPRMGQKLIWTTVISTILFAVLAYCYSQDYFNIERLNHLMGLA